MLFDVCGMRRPWAIFQLQSIAVASLSSSISGCCCGRVDTGGRAGVNMVTVVVVVVVVEVLMLVLGLSPLSPVSG